MSILSNQSESGSNSNTYKQGKQVGSFSEYLKSHIYICIGTIVGIEVNSPVLSLSWLEAKSFVSCPFGS